MNTSQAALLATCGFMIAGPPSVDAQDGPPDVSERRSRTAVMVHRGSLDFAVENSLAAIEAAFLTGADGVEIDIAQTADGVLVLMHDPWIDRVLDGFGNIADLTYEQVQRTSFRKPRGLTRADERVPTLRQAFELIGRYNGLIHLDVKTPGIDGRIHKLLEEMDLFENVVTVNDYNSEAIRADSRIKVLRSQGSLIHGNNDYDAKAVRKHLARRPLGTFLVDDARCAAALLGRKDPVRPEDLVLAPLPTKPPTQPKAGSTDADVEQIVRKIGGLEPVTEFDAGDGAPRKAKTIRRRAVLARALGRKGIARPQICRTLESMIAQRSLHVDGAWQGLDGSEAAKALAILRPDAATVRRLTEAVYRIDPRLTAVEKRPDLPWWLKQSGSWWDFRIKSEAIAALGAIKSAQAKDALRQMLALPETEAKAAWRELHWDAARALTSGTWRLSAEELKQLLTHPTSGVRRAGSVYLARHPDRQEYQHLMEQFLSWWTNK